MGFGWHTFCTFKVRKKEKEVLEMAIKKWKREEESPWRSSLSLQDEMEGLMDDLLAPWHEARFFPRISWAPKLDVSEDDNSITITADVPGVKPEELDISISGDTLIIQGERKKEEEKKEKNYHSVERVYGSFRREIGFPSTVDASKIKASYKEGVLNVFLPKLEKKKPKKVKVEVK